MTYQKILEEFAVRRMRESNSDITGPMGNISERLDNINWAIQSILEKLCDESQG